MDDDSTCSIADDGVVSTAHILTLPMEIIEAIVTHSSLDFTDYCRLSHTCTVFHSVIDRSWKTIVTNKWRWWSNDCISLLSVEDGHSWTWYRLGKERYRCERQLQALLHITIRHGVRQYLLDDEDIECYGQMVLDNNPDDGLCSQTILECVLMEILNKDIKECNLSHQYYGLCIYEYLKRLQLKKEWMRYLSRDNHLLIEGAILLSQWINPIDGSSIIDIVNKEMESIAQLTAVHLLGRASEDNDVSVATDLTSTVSLMKSLKLSRYDILSALNHTMFSVLGYKPATDDYYKLDNSLIEKVIDRRRGIPITLSAVYQCAAHQLGVELLPVNFPAHFLLKLEVDHSMGEGEMFIDVFNDGQFLSQEECLRLIPFLSVTSSDVFKSVPVHKALMRMVTNIYQRDPFSLNFDVGRQWVNNKWSPMVLPSSVSLQLFLCGVSPVCDFTSTVAASAAEIALDLKYNTKQVSWVMSDICTSISPSVYVLTKLQRSQYAMEKKKKALNEPTRVKRRSDQILYTVGMIMEHTRYDYKCVIYGWDTTCEMTDQWIQQMGVNQLPLGQAQPFYNVLVDDGTNRYAAQENLAPCPKHKVNHITHWEIGKYFYKFTGDRYLPNHALLEKYPD